MNSNLTFKNGTYIEWNHGDDGGGSNHYKDFLEAIGTTKKYSKGLEWCAGLSAIAFSLIDANICEHFTLMDLYEPALKKAKENAVNNNFSVNYYVCDKVNSMPKNQKFDLVVANPPHALYDHWISVGEEYDTIHRLTVDLDWHLHKEFYENIVSYLNPNADIYISQVYSDITLDEYIKSAGLVTLNKIPAKQLSIDSNIDAFIRHLRYEA